VSAGPAALAALAAEFRDLDRRERAELLIEWADRFTEVPPEVATRPFPEAHHVQRCESEAYVWAVDRPDGTLDLHFAVENPQGLSAKAWAAILAETCAGRPPAEIAAIDGDVVFAIFGRDLSMGKGQGLLGMLDLVSRAARQRLVARDAGGPHQ